MRKFYQLLTLASFFLVNTLIASGQNNLAPGDIAIVSYQADVDPSNTFNTAVAEREDRFSIVVLRPGGLAAGTVIYFTDRGWDGPNNTWLDNVTVGREAVIKWVVPAGGIAQNTEIFFINLYHDELGAGNEIYTWDAFYDEAGTLPAGVVTTETALPVDGMGFSVAGDNLLVYQAGPPAGPAGPYNDATIRFITGLLANVVTNGTTYPNWDATPLTLNESSLPPGLVNGQTAFVMSTGPLPCAGPCTAIEFDNGKYNCTNSTTGCTALILSTTIYTVANWTMSNTVFPLGESSSECTYAVGGGITINAPTVTQPNCTTPTGTIVVNATGTGTLEYSLNGGTYQTSATFSGLAAGNYNITVRSQSNPSCVVAYSSNPVVLNAPVDVIPPTLSCPISANVDNTTGLCTGTYTIIDPITDNCTGATWSASFSGNVNGNPASIGPIADGSNSSPIVFFLGTTTVTLTGVDASGNTATSCSFSVTVSDTQVPVVTCPSNVTINTGICQALYTIVNPFTDNCPGGTWSATFSGNAVNPAPTGPIAAGANSAPILFNQGLTTVTLNGVDAALNNAVSCQFTVNVVSNIPAVLCGTPTTVTLPAGTGIWNSLSCIFNTPGTEKLYTFTPTVSGTYTFNVTFVGSGLIDYSYKPVAAGCGQSGWTCIGSMGGPGSVTFGPLTAGVTYYILADNELTVSNTHTFNIPCLCSITCPANVTQNNTLNQCGAVVNYPPATIVGSCGAVTYSTPSGSFFPVGTTTVTVTTAAGSSCTFNVTVNDTQPPGLNCTNTSLSTDAGVCTRSYAIPDRVSDNCTGATWSASFSGNPLGNPAGFGSIADGSNGPARTFQKGNTTVTLTAVDAAGNTNTCNYTITVNDTELPLIGCVGNQTRTVGRIGCTWMSPDNSLNASFSDNCPGASISYTLTGATTGTGSTLNGVIFNEGVTNVNWVATDASGNSATCSFTLTVVSGATVTATNNSPICSGGNSTVTVTPTPAAGGTVSWTFTSSPGITPANGAGSAPSAATVQINQVFINSNAAPGTVTYNITYTTALGCVVTTTSVVTVRSAVNGTILNSGGQTTCAGNSGQVNVFLNGSPSFNGSFSILVLNGSGVSTPVFNWTTPGSGPQAIIIPAANLTNTSQSATTYRISWGSLSDANGCLPLAGGLSGFDDIVVMPLPQLQTTLLSGASPVCPGSTITFRVEHPVGNTVPANFQWFANGILQGSNIDFDAAGGATVSFVTSNNCNLANVFLFQPRADGQPYCQGSDVIRVVTSQDVTAPALVASPPALLNASGTTVTPGAQGNLCNPPQATYQPTVASVRARYTDNCTSNANLVVTPGPVVNDCPMGGPATNCCWRWTYNFSIADACGNSTSASYVFTGGDTGAPLITTTPGSLNRTVQYCDNVALANAQALTVTGIDNCTAVGNLVINKVAGVFAVGSCPTQGSITNTFTIADQCGNTSSFITQVITIVDTQGPSITGANTQTLNIGGPGCQALLPNYVTGTGGIAPNSSLVPLVITDCAAPGGLFPAPQPITYNQAGGNNTSTQSPAPGTLIIGAGGQIVPVTITATDACGNQSTFVINVNLLDQTPPVARCHNVTLALGAGGSATLTPTQINGNQNNVAGNGTAPSGTPAGSGLGVGAFPSTDNCSPVPTPSLTLTFPFGATSATYTCANIGGNLLTLVVTDAANNSTNCLATVTVVDAIAPTFTCPGTQTISRNANCVATLPDFATSLGIVASDNCTPSGSITFTQNPVAGSIYGAGVTTTNVTLTATDGSGNSFTCNIIVNFADNTAPVITCQGNITATTGAGNTDCSVNVIYTIPTATDNCQGPGFPGAITTVRIAGPASGGQFFVGTTTVTYRATDAAGNSSTCSFVVTVLENTPPTIVCQGNKMVNAGAGCVYTHTNTSWDPTIFDNCLLANPPVIFTGSGATTFGPVNTLVGRSFNIGTTTVTATAMDASGNVSAPCTFTVTVVDAGVPTFTNCPVSYTVTTQSPNGLAGCRANVNIAQPNSIQNCTTIQEWFITGATPNSSGIGTFPTTFPMNVGVTQVQFRLSDANGNSATCTYFVTVNNISASTIGGTATAQQNAATTSTITFTGSGGTPNYCFTYDISVNGGPFGAPQTVCTTGGQNSVTVSQSNAVTGTYQYRLLNVTDANGCPGTVPASPNNVATITVIVGAPDLTSSQFFTSTQISAGGTINEVIVLRNVGTAPTSGAISFTVTNYSALSGLTVTPTPAGTNVTVGIDTYTVSAGWSFNAATGTFTSNNVIPAGGSNTIGLTITRGTGGSAGANGAVTQTTTIAPGTGGGETPSNNNTISNTILKN